MNNISFFCLTLDPLHEEKIKKLSYIPVGLGKNDFSKNTLQDKDGENISKEQTTKHPKGLLEA